MIVEWPLESFITSIHSAKLPWGGRDSPVPKIASTIASPAATPVDETLTPSLSRVCRCRAAASPSPALLPTPHTTAAGRSKNRAICQPAASISQSVDMPKRSSQSESTSLTWRLLRVGRALDDKGAVGVAAVDGSRLGDGGAREP